MVSGYQAPDVIILDQKVLSNKLAFNLLRNKFGSVRMFFIVDSISEESANKKFFLLRTEMKAENLSGMLGINNFP